MELMKSPALELADAEMHDVGRWAELAALYATAGFRDAAEAIRTEAAARARWGGLKRALIEGAPHYGTRADTRDAARARVDDDERDGDGDGDLVRGIAALLMNSRELREPTNKPHGQRLRPWGQVIGYTSRFFGSDDDETSTRHAQQVRVLWRASKLAHGRWQTWRQHLDGSFAVKSEFNGRALAGVAGALADARAVGALPLPPVDG
jgi:hypothetical protein